MSAKHDIKANQGSSLYLHFQYLDEDGNPIDIRGWSGEMQVRRSVIAGEKLLHVAGPTGITCGNTGHTGAGLTGGISLHRNMGNTGDLTGGILVIAGATSTSLIPSGVHQYDLELRNPSGVVTRLVEGRFDCSGEVTK
tara:strand:+ start:2934 stop:3347 length:414 start_codon:yes stop_codon:yes gene_type:complete